MSSSVEVLRGAATSGGGGGRAEARLAEVATTPMFFTPAEFGAYMAAEIEKWGKVVRFAGIKLE